MISFDNSILIMFYFAEICFFIYSLKLYKIEDIFVYFDYYKRALRTTWILWGMGSGFGLTFVRQSILIINFLTNEGINHDLRYQAYFLCVFSVLKWL